MRSPRLRLVMRLQQGEGSRVRGMGGSSQQSAPSPPRIDRETVNKSAAMADSELLQYVKVNRRATLGLRQ